MTRRDARPSALDRLSPVGLWIFVFLFFVLTTNLFGQSWFSLLRLAQHGRTVTASVSVAHTSNHDGCEFTFTAGGRTFHGSRESCGDREVGDALTITYLPSDPTVHSGYSPASHLVTAVAFALLLPTAATGLLVWRRRARPTAA